MASDEDWHIFDPKDVNSAPESGVEIIAEYDNGRLYRGYFYRDSGIFQHHSLIGPNSAVDFIGNARMVRWSYPQKPSWTAPGR